MRNEEYDLDIGRSVHIVRVSKKAAEKAYNAGKEIVVAACNANLNRAWKPYAVVSNNELNFDNFVNAYKFYNCNREMGMYLKFFTIEY